MGWRLLWDRHIDIGEDRREGRTAGNKEGRENFKIKWNKRTQWHRYHCCASITGGGWKMPNTRICRSLGLSIARWVKFPPVASPQRLQEKVNYETPKYDALLWQPPYTHFQMQYQRSIGLYRLRVNIASICQEVGGEVRGPGGGGERPNPCLPVSFFFLFQCTAITSCSERRKLLSFSSAWRLPELLKPPRQWADELAP